jgi:hypothetical protein
VSEAQFKQGNELSVTCRIASGSVTSMPAAPIDSFDQLTLRYMTVEQSSQVARRFPDVGVIGMYSATNPARRFGA